MQQPQATNIATADTAPTRHDRLRGWAAPVTLFILSLLFFGFLAVTSRGSTPSALDQDAVRFFQQFDAPWYDALMHALSDFGYTPWTIIMPAAILALLLVLREWPAAVGLLVAQSVNLAYWGVKALVQRARPGIEFGAYEGAKLNDSSFPSGHIATATALYGFCIYLAWTRLGDRPVLRWTVIVLCAAVIVLTTPSRLYLAAHWLSDIVGGYLIGFAWLLLAVFAYRALMRRAGRNVQA
jgi:undecaprenyl-diphosphatase